jgi:predicted RNA methylase
MLNPNMTVYDLGAGFGRIMLEAAKSGATVIGYEIDHAKVYWIRQKIKQQMFTKDRILNMDVVQGNLLDADFSKADLLYAYLSPPLMRKIGEKAMKEMRVGARIISVEHQIPDWQPTFVDLKDKIYMYQKT